ncbi:MAG: hypothetical protein IPQ07_41155 [Myxococcales bacterium]|nr:hypothetical protein [Myxococcales bacterium]
MAEIDDLRTQMAALEDRVRDLHQELARAAVGRIRSMRDTRRCPACGGGHLFRMAATEMAHAGPKPLAIHHTSGFWGTTIKGQVEYFVCRGCLLIESHAIDLAGIEHDGKTVIAIDPEPDVPAEGPFR